MKHPSAAQQSAILSHFSYNAEGKIRLRATSRTEAILRLAGVTHPKALEYYSVPVRRDGKGFLVVDTDAEHRPPVGESDDELFEPGGLFGKVTEEERAAWDFAVPRVDSVRPDTSADLTVLSEILCSRTFEIATGPHTKIRVQVVGYIDESLPSPGERERWKPCKPTDTEVHAAVAALHRVRGLADLEKV